VLIERIRGVQTSAAPADLQRWRALDASAIALENNCRRLHARFVRGRPALLKVCEALAAAPPEPAEQEATG
jgi:hypothetical protein